MFAKDTRPWSSHTARIELGKGSWSIKHTIVPRKPNQLPMRGISYVMPVSNLITSSEEAYRAMIEVDIRILVTNDSDDDLTMYKMVLNNTS